MEAAAQPSSTSAKHLEVFDRFLAEEAALRLPDVDVSDRARFHRVVRQCALAWSRHPKAGFHVIRNRHALALAFDGPIEGKNISLITFRSAAEFGDYRFHALHPSAIPSALSPQAKTALQRLRDLYSAALPGVFDADGAVGVAVKRQPSIDFLPIIDEARRVLDEGNQDFPPVDMRELMIVPAEHARYYVGRTNVVPVVRPKPEPPPPVTNASKNGAGKAAANDDDDDDSTSSEEETTTNASTAAPVATKSKSKAKAPAKPAAPVKKPSSSHAAKNGSAPTKKPAAPAAKKPAAATKKPATKAKKPSKPAAKKPAPKAKPAKKSR